MIAYRYPKKAVFHIEGSSGSTFITEYKTVLPMLIAQSVKAAVAKLQGLKAPPGVPWQPVAE